MPDSTSKSRYVLVTGASSGIGAALARLAAKSGWRIWIGYNSGRDSAEILAQGINETGGWARAVRLPLDDPRALQKGLDFVSELDAVALAASPAPLVTSFLKLSAKQIRHQFECGVVGNHAILTHAWRTSFRPRGGGHVLAVLSAAAGPSAASHMAGYVAAKGGLEALLRAAAAELGPAGLKISIVRPGFVETPMLKAFPDLVLERARAQKPFLSAEDVAAALVSALNSPPMDESIAELPLEFKMAS